LSKGVLIEQEILHLLEKKHLRFTPTDLEKEVRRNIPCAGRRHFRAALRKLVSNGRLVYTQHFSTTHLEMNCRSPFRVSNRIIIAPGNYNKPHDQKKIIIKLQDGYAFGAGDHPTTRLVLQALDFVLGPTQEGVGRKINHVLDIGTGTGILAIAAAGMGVSRVVAIDTDPAACLQAKNNVALNGYAQSIKIVQKSLDHVSGDKFDLLMANLRPPTLRQLFDNMLAISSENSTWILSGFRTEERKQINKYMPIEMSEIVWERVQHDWVAFAVNGKHGTEEGF
jgi:ribosomal protein L11 methyltransferase